MKKAFMTTMLLLAGLAASAQDDVYGSGKKGKADTEKAEAAMVSDTYEKQEVVTVDSVSAVVLYERAMIALSDWTGADGKSKIGIDYQNQETHTVIYKGRYSLGFKNTFLGDGWERYADFTLRVRCKDGRAQVTVTVPTMTAKYNRNGMTRQWTYGELVKQVEKSSGNRHERGVGLLEDLKDTADWLLLSMMQRLKDGGGDDDF